MGSMVGLRRGVLLSIWCACNADMQNKGHFQLLYIIFKMCYDNKSITLLGFFD